MLRIKTKVSFQQVGETSRKMYDFITSATLTAHLIDVLRCEKRQEEGDQGPHLDVNSQPALPGLWRSLSPHFILNSRFRFHNVFQKWPDAPLLSSPADPFDDHATSARRPEEAAASTVKSLRRGLDPAVAPIESDHTDPLSSGGGTGPSNPVRKGRGRGFSGMRSGEVQEVTLNCNPILLARLQREVNPILFHRGIPGSGLFIDLCQFHTHRPLLVTISLRL